MKFTVITHAVHKINFDDIYAYEPYVREMNLWFKHVKYIRVVAPISREKISALDSKYTFKNITIKKILTFNVINLKNIFFSFFKIPLVIIEIFKNIIWADHIHIRCPGNIGLLACFVQIFFPSKSKTIKYAGNWDPKSKQPISYKLQKWILSNTFLTKNAKVLVYGNWKNQSKNIVPFFTASYMKKEIVDVPKKDFSSKIKFIFVGTFSKGKQPLKSVKIVESLSKKHNVQLDMYGFGNEFDKVKKYVKNKKLSQIVKLHGNQSKEIVKKAYQTAHFLIFISQSEGWPKVVAEAMFWGCLPISTNVSCVKDMLGNNSRGTVIDFKTHNKEITAILEDYLKSDKKYQKKVDKAIKWSQQFTLEKFEKEIKKVL